jgi:bacterioferritin-associated ferredoxin
MPKRILCHCEDIEIEELYSAIHQGYGDVETLKRYTGIGTGKCQGKCCFVQTLRALEEFVNRSSGDSEAGVTGDSIRIPTLRPPVLPLRIKDIIEGGNDER